MSGTLPLRGRRRAIPPNLLTAAAVPRPTAPSSLGALSPRSLAALTPRLIPRTPLPQATALPTPIERAFTTLYTTTRVITETLTTVYPDEPTAAPTGLVPPPQQGQGQGQQGLDAGGLLMSSGVAAMPTVTGPAGLGPAGAAPTLDVSGGAGTTAPTADGGFTASIGPPGQNMMPMIIGISGAASLSLLGVAGFFIARRRRMMGADVKLSQNKNTKIRTPSRDSLDAARAQAIAGQLVRPYSSRYWIQ